MLKFFDALIHDESGVTAIEYGLLAAAIAAVCATAFTNVGTDIKKKFESLHTVLSK
ncbi:MAG TPA: Flp family type IVb pilin [Azospirillum sp.]|nr:Flp family type IVb pilin [Azospirillum sp.]